MKIKILFFLLIISMTLSGCKTEGRCCDIKVVTNYSGWGIDGQKLENGSYSRTYTVKAGDIFYETHNGIWELNSEKNDKGVVIAEITGMDEKGVTLIIDGNETVIKYGTGHNVPSLFVAYDGVNFTYTVTVSGYSE